MDIITIGAQLQAKGVAGISALNDIIPTIMEIFGQINIETHIIKEDLSKKDISPKKGTKDPKNTKREESKKEEVKKEETLHKDESNLKDNQSPPPSHQQSGVGLPNPQKIIEIKQKLASYQDFMAAIENIKNFDETLCKLGVLKAPSLVLKVEEIIQKEENEREKELEKRKIVKSQNSFNEDCEEMTNPNGLPNIPIRANNAICINLFCIDENYESRSIDFLEYAFILFPDRDYIILTQPHTVPENTLLQSFIQASKKKDCIFDHVLYLFHKDALLTSLISVTFYSHIFLIFSVGSKDRN